MTDHEPLWWTDVRPEPRPKPQPRQPKPQAAPSRCVKGCGCERCEAKREKATQRARAHPDTERGPERRLYKTAKQREYDYRTRYAPQITSGVKLCKGCDTMKPFDQFWPDNSKPLGVESRCKECKKASARARYQRERARKPSAQIQRHGRAFSKQVLYEAQHGLCYLCQQPLPTALHLIHLDHDHTCCPPPRSCHICRRGLACGQCNTAIGLAGDDPVRMRLMADNLERALGQVRQRMAEQVQSQAVTNPAA